MTEADVLNLTAQTLMLVLVLSLPPIIGAALVGTLVSLLQALTQIQDQTLAFGIKLITVIVIIFLTARWAGMELFNFTVAIFNSLPTLE